MNSKLNRILIITLFGLGFGLFGCQGPAATEIENPIPEAQIPSPAAVTEPATSGSFYSEAPALAAKVAAGELPPVDERLPTNPMIIRPVERVGVYGGTWRRAMRPERDHVNFIRSVGYENLMRWDEQWTRAIPNIAQSVEVNEDATEFTFRLREGMHWSDGQPFTTDDIMFWYEAVYSNEALVQTIPGVSPPWLTRGGEPVAVEKVDESTVVFRFTTPNGLFLQNLAAPWGIEPTAYPRHYFAQFHVEYNPDVGTLVEEAGVSDWVELFGSKGIDSPTRWANPDLPTLHAWVLVNGHTVGVEQVVAERNPYYWKVDTDGNQLPYIDRIVFTTAADVQEMITRALSGEIDMQARHIANEDDRATYEGNQVLGDFSLFRTLPDRANIIGINLNLTHQDPVLRGIFQNRDFRIGLSHAINRQEIIDLVYVGQGEPYQAAPSPNSPFYHQRLATQYVGYDVDLANEYLDRAGYSQRSADGVRLGPDGRPISFTVEVSDSPANRRWPEAMALVQAYWREVGVEIKIEVEDRALFYDRKAANEPDATVWGATGGIEVVLDPRAYFPASNESNFAIPWAYWYQDPDNPLAQEPPAAAQQQMALYNQLIATGEQSEQNALMMQILDIAAEQFYVIGIVLPAEGYGIVKNNFHNVPTVMPGSWAYPHPAPANPSQFFIDPQG